MSETIKAELTGVFAEDAFARKVVLVSGGTSGIGAATAKAFAACGAKVMIAGLGEAEGESVRKAIAGSGGEAACLIGDVTDPAYSEAVVGATVERFGRLDILFNNAGIFLGGPIEEMTDADWRRLMDVNVNGAFYMARAAVRQMKRQGKGGAIVNTASDGGLIGVAGATAYCATKGAIVQITRCMALELAPDGIRVNAVCPSDTETAMIDQVYELFANMQGKALDVVREEARIYIPIGRRGTVDEIASAVLYLASDGASFITGAMLSVDGGATAD